METQTKQPSEILETPETIIGKNENVRTSERVRQIIVNSNMRLAQMNLTPYKLTKLNINYKN